METHLQPTKTTRNYQQTDSHPPSNGVSVNGRKFMLTLRESVYEELEKVADRRGVTIQGLIRAVIVPEWHMDHSRVNNEGPPLELSDNQSNEPERFTSSYALTRVSRNR